MGTFLKRLFRTRQAVTSCPECSAGLADGVVRCDTCGYDLIRRTRDAAPGPHRVV